MQYSSGRTVLTAILLLVATTAQAQKTVDEIVVRVNGDIILKSEVENAIAALRNELSVRQKLQGAPLDQAFAEQSKFILRDLIDQNLLLQQSREMGLNADLEVVKTMERMRQEYKFDSMAAPLRISSSRSERDI